MDNIDQFGKNNIGKIEHVEYLNINSTHSIPQKLTPTIGLSNQDSFVGRKEELKEIDNILKESNKILLINGIGGIGKSTIALYYLTKISNEYDYYGYIGVDRDIKESFVSELKSSLNIHSEQIEDMFKEAITKLQNLQGKKLLIIDDIKDIANQKDAIDTISNLSNSDFKIIFTSRENLEDIPHYFLDVMHQDDAIALFNKYYPTNDIQKVKELLEYIDYHTYFIEIVAKLLKQRTTINLDDILTKFKNGKFTNLKAKRKKSFNNLLDELFAREEDSILQDRELLNLIQKLSILPSIEISLEYLIEILDYEAQDLEELLYELVENGLLIKYNSHYKLHQIIKEYILSNHIPPIETTATLFDYFYNIIIKSSQSDRVEDKLTSLIYYTSISDYFIRISYRDEKVANFENQLGILYFSLAEYEMAMKHLNQSLTIRQEIGDKAGEGTALNNVSQIYVARGDYDKALELLQKSLTIRQEIGDKAGEGTALNNIASIYHARGDYDKALELLQKSLTIGQEIGDKAGVSVTLFNIGLIYLENEELNQAISKWLDSYLLSKEIGYREALNELDNLAKALGSDEGLEMWEKLAIMLNRE